jgi:hypothetical protein
MKRLTCSCGKVLGYEPRHAGKKVKCGGCGKALTVPVDEEDKNAPLAMQPVEDEEPPRSRSRAAVRKREEDDDEPRPPKRKKAYKEEPDTSFGRRDTTLNHVANYFSKNALFPVIFCALGFLLPWGIYEYLVTRNASSTPQRIAANELSEKGPGNNYHVIVTGASPQTPFVWTRTTQTPGSPQKHVAYLGFFVPLDARGDGSFRVLLKSDLTDEDKFKEVLRRGEYHGTIMNSVESLSEKEQDALRKHYPNTDFSKVWIIEEGREPRSPLIVLLLFVFGIVGPVAGGTVFAIMAMYRTSADS